MSSSESSLATSSDSESEYGDPIQLHNENVPQTRLRKLSKTTSSLFQRNMTNSSRITRAYSLSGVHDEGLGLEDYTGLEPIYRSLSEYTINEDNSVGRANSDEVGDFYPKDYAQLQSDGIANEPLRRRTSTVTSVFQNITRKLGFWDDEFVAERVRIVTTLLKNYVYLLLGFTCALCLYWGTYYQRTSRYKNLQFAVIIGDAEVSPLTPVLGEFVSEFFQDSAVTPYGDFHIWNYTRISTLAASHNNTLEQEAIRQVHHQHYLAAFFVHENATARMYEALSTHNSSFDPSLDLLSVFYETGSDYNAMSNFVSTILQTLCQSFIEAMRTGPWSPYWMHVFSEDEILDIFSDAPTLLTSLPGFALIDKIPVPAQVVQAPFQIGLIYLCIFTFFQFIFSLPIHLSVAPKLKGMKFVVFRILTAQGAYIVLSLSYVTLNTAFQMPFTRTFGHSGFLVIWAFGYLTMSSVGSLIEILVLFCVVLKPAMIGLCLLLVAILNLAPTISPIYLCPTFYRYGYAMPVYNSYHLMMVAYFNSYKGHMGRHIGILVAWVLVTNAFMPFVLKWVSKKMQERAAAAAAEKEAASADKSDDQQPQPRITSPASAVIAAGNEKVQT